AFVRALMSMQLVTYLSGGLPGLIFSAGAAGVFVYGGWRVIHGSTSIGTFVAFLAYPMRFLPALQGRMTMYGNLPTLPVSLAPVSELLDERVDVQRRSDAVPLPALRGDIAFEDVTVAFDRGGPVLEHLSFTVGAGEIVALMGASGSGKSTIADLL